MLSLILAITAICLVLVNAFFVASEFGMVRLRHTRVQTMKDSYGLRGYILEQVHKNLDSYLSACQLGITLASLGLGWIGEPAFAKLLDPVFSSMGIGSAKFTTISAFVVAFGLISFLHIVVGELMPKSLAIRQPEAVSVWTAIPLYGFYWLMYPFIWLLNICSNFFLKKCGLDRSKSDENIYSIEELKLILNGSHSSEELTEEETKILEHTIDLTELEVTEVMRPAQEMILLNINEPILSLLRKIAEHRYSRYPIFDPNKKEIIGIVHVKDLFAVLLQQQSIHSLEAVIRPILKVNHNLPAMNLLNKFREGMPHFALVYEGKDNLLGFVTLDNLLHIMIGRIKDEFHRTHDDWIKNPDGSFYAKGTCSLYSLETALNCDIDLMEGEEDLDTLAGLIINRVGFIPKPGDKINLDNFEITIEEVHGAIIDKVKIVIKCKATTIDSGETAEQ